MGEGDTYVAGVVRVSAPTRTRVGGPPSTWKCTSNVHGHPLQTGETGLDPKERGLTTDIDGVTRQRSFGTQTTLAIRPYLVVVTNEMDNRLSYHRKITKPLDLSMIRYNDIMKPLKVKIYIHEYDTFFAFHL